jgi:uncharacterized protein
MAKATKGPRPKHVPLRTCIVCRQERGKRELVRIVRTPSASVQLDPTGKLAGRGAYLCRARTCWEQALQGQRLSAALKATVSADDMAALRAFAATLPETLPTTSGRSPTEPDGARSRDRSQ